MQCNVCAVGYVLKNGICQACPVGCNTCAFTSTGVINCTSCLTTFTSKKQQNIASCVCSGGKQLQLTPAPAKCVTVTCNSPCNTCSSSNVCLTCVN